MDDKFETITDEQPKENRRNKLEDIIIEEMEMFRKEENIDQFYDTEEYLNQEVVKEEEKKDITEFLTKVDDYVMENEILNDTKDKNRIVTNNLYYQCPLCNTELPWYGDGVTITLDECNHLFCRYCVSNALESIINHEMIKLKCPYPECEKLIDEEKYNIEDLVDSNLYTKYLMVLTDILKNDSQSRVFRCKTLQCLGWCIIEDERVINFLCPICKRNNDIDLGYVETEDKDYFEQSERYKELMLLTENNIVPNFNPFECPICFCSYQSYEGLVLKNCLHEFCKQCIANTVNFSTEVDVKCPFKDDNYSCDEIIQQCEIKEVLKPIDFTKYLERSINQAEAKAGQSAYHCKTPNCPGWCIYEKDVDNFLCPVCNKTNCLRCKMIHKVSCIDDMMKSDFLLETEKSDLLINQMIERNEAMLCPKCGIVITKISGCDQIFCTACKSQICWVTKGLRWGPEGVGDTSGGCKCSSFKRCHPLCKDCH